MPDVGKAVTRHELYDVVNRKVELSRTESSPFVERVAKLDFSSVVASELLRRHSNGYDLPPE